MRVSIPGITEEKCRSRFGIEVWLGGIMAIQKNERTGNYFVTYVPFVDRTNRKPFIKAPLVRQRSQFVQFFIDLFRGGPNPFLASPIATAVDRRLKVEKRAKALAGGGSPD